MYFDLPTDLESGVAMEELQLHNDTVEVPVDIFTDTKIFKHIFRYGEIGLILCNGGRRGKVLYHHPPF